MKTYHVAVVIRPDGERRESNEFAEERVREGTILALTPTGARRGVLEHTWKNGWLVSSFLSVECLDKEAER